jgi:uncharacterized damage-inducible protein DinB
MKPPLPDAWLRGPIDGVPPLLLPAAHAFVGAAEDVGRAATELPAEALWLRPGGAASPGFHLRHLVGSTARLLTYARGEQLTPEQVSAKAREEAPGDGSESVEQLTRAAQAALAEAVDFLRRADADRLLEPREVGRARLPTTTLGAIFHAAEHAQRHAGQFVTTVKFLRDSGAPPA